MAKRYWAAAANDIETNPCLVEGWVPVHLSSDYDALAARCDARGEQIEIHKARIRDLEAALRKIGAYEKDAREMVAKGFHNTTLAIDLSGMANAALTTLETLGDADGKG